MNDGLGSVHDVGDRGRRGEQHLVGDVARLRVEQPAEDAGEREHVVDLVRVVRPAGGDDRGVLLRHARVDLGVGVGQREHDRVGRHRGELGGAEQVRRRHADEDVGADQRVGAACPTRRAGVGVLGDPGQVVVEARAGPGARSRRRRRPARRPAPSDASSRMIAEPAAPDPADDDPAVGELLADHPQRVAQRAEHHDRGAVLVVVEDRDVEQLAQPRLDLEAARARRCPRG